MSKTRLLKLAAIVVVVCCSAMIITQSPEGLFVVDTRKSWLNYASSLMNTTSLPTTDVICPVLNCNVTSAYIRAQRKLNYIDCDISMLYIRCCLNHTSIGRKPLANFYLYKNISDSRSYKEYRNANIAFVHLPKAGGTSVESVLNGVSRLKTGAALKETRVSHCSDLYQQAIHSRRNSAQTLFYSKRTFGLHNYAYPERPFVYVTWIRDPISRLLSTYFYTRKTDCFHVHDICRKYVTKSSNLTDYLLKTSKLHFQDMDNFYVRLLQFGDFPEIDTTFEDCCGGVELKDAHTIPAIQKKHFLVAKRNLEQKFGFIGLMEDFKTSKEMLTRLFGISHDDDIHINSNPHSYNLTDYEFNELSRRNIWDIKLYKIAKKIYQQQKDNFLKLESKL